MPSTRSESALRRHISSCLALLRGKSGNQVVPIGAVSAEIFDLGWPDRVTNETIVIRERRQHYLRQHPDLEPDVHEPLLIRAILEPDEVHRNARDPSIAIIYQVIPEDSEHVLRVALWISGAQELRNSVHSMRLARRKEMCSGRETGRRVWPA